MATLLEKTELIEEIKGIRRVVVNKCHGGFGLSEEAVNLYLQMLGKQVWVEVDSKYKSLNLCTYWLIPPDADRVEASPSNWHDMTMAERAAHNKKYTEQVFRPDDIERDDPYLVSVVKQLGKKASGRFAELEIVEIPEDVNWMIEEYDGLEWVAEKHRTWR
jgi:hypothetical protein